MLIDAHCHILWGVDDASKNEEETLKMLNDAVEDGIDIIISTSHIHPRYPSNTAHTFHEALLRVQNLIEKHQLPIKVVEGAEMYFNEERLATLDNEYCVPINHTKYLLVELPWTHDESKMNETRILQHIIKKGFYPIIAHPERYEVIHNNPNLIDEWIKMGCLMQVNRTSLLDLDHIQKANEVAKEMLKNKQIHCIGSDAHRVNPPRTPKLSDAYEIIANELGESEAIKLCGGNAEKILAGEKII